MKNIKTLLLVIFGLMTYQAWATWSIIAVDNTTGEVGVAGASCNRNVGVISKCVPGKGVIVVQAAGNFKARESGFNMIKQGATTREIITALKNVKYDFEIQQYGVVVLNQSPEVYTGKENYHWNGEMHGGDFSVQGNTLVSEAVVANAYKAYLNAEGKHITERLMLALEAGAKAGGDRRCVGQEATSAFVTVYKPNDKPRNPYVHLYVSNVDAGAQSAVGLLSKEFEHWKLHYQTNPSTQILIVPPGENVMVQNTNMSLVQYNHIVKTDGSVIACQSVGKAKSNFLTRNQFVDKFAKIKYQQIHKIVSALGMENNEYTVSNVKQINAEIDIHIVIEILEDKINIETNSYGQIKKETYPLE